jgi:hypothetical protein
MRAYPVIALAIMVARPAAAQDPFEIQVYDVETAPRGEPGLEVHVNYHAIEGAPDEMHTTFEPHYGLRAWAELGGYLQTSVDTDNNIRYAGIKLRLKLRWPTRVWNERLGLAVNGELSAVPARFEPIVYGSELRPVLDLAVGRWYAAVNPIVTFDLAGNAAGHPQLEPAAKASASITSSIALGVEAYAAFGPIDDLGSERFARVLGVVDVRGSWWDLDVGAGETLGSADHFVVKLIVGIHPATKRQQDP